MMELWSILVLCFASIVTATPHGYGVKGGASAKAEANAAAFAGLPAIPLNIPSGPGFSGSYSKSSSSSFASSSASSSSSSSSFSFSGSGANDLGNNGGCSGGCHNKGANDGTTSSNGAFDGAYKNYDINNSGNTAVSPTGQDISNVPNYSKNNQPCEGGNCNGNNYNHKCISGQCHTGHQYEVDEDRDSEEDAYDKPCTSSNCKHGYPKQTNGENESNDIKINIGKDIKQTSDDKSSSFGGYRKDEKSTNGCLNGNCYPADSHISQSPNIYDNNNVRIPAPASGVTETPKCRTPNCESQISTSPSQENIVPGYGKPSQHLTTPHDGPACTTFPCSTTSSGTNNIGKSPISYNVPITAIPEISPVTQNKNSPCLSGPCLNNDFKNSIPNLPSINSPYATPPGASLLNTCTTGTCKIGPDTTINSGRATQPSYSTTSYSHGINSDQYPLPTSGSPSCQGSNCNKPSYKEVANQPLSNIPSNCGLASSPGCVHNPDFISSPGGVPGYHADLPKLGHPTAPYAQPGLTGPKIPLQNIDTQTGYSGFSRGSGVYNTNNDALNFNAPKLPTPNTGLAPPSVNYPTYSGSYVNPNLPSTISTPGYPTKLPNTGIHYSTENIPKYTSTFGSSEEGFSEHTDENSNHNPNSPSSYSLNSGAPNRGSHSPSNSPSLLKPNDFGATGQYYPTYTPVPSGGVSSLSPVIPKTGINNVPKSFAEKEKIPYSGGFGGPGGLLKPNEYNLPAKIPTSSVDLTSDSCLSGDCSPKTRKSEIINTAPLPAASASANAKAVAYTGGFGGPPGFLKPNDYEKPANFIPLNSKGAQNFVGLPQHSHSVDNSGNSNGHPVNEEDNSGSYKNANGIAQASAVASAQADAIINSNKDKNGCNLCNAPHNNNRATGNYGSSTGLTSSGIHGDNSDTNNHNGALASAKSVANAGAGSYGHGGSFASSFASAHASAGVPTKGGYGRR